MSTQLKIVMFTDQVDSTLNMARRTANENERISHEQEALTIELVSSCKGQIIKDTGDGHLIEFLSCADAVRCGWLLQQRIKAKNIAQISNTLRFELHIGIDVGEFSIMP